MLGLDVDRDAAAVISDVSLVTLEDQVIPRQPPKHVQPTKVRRQRKIRNDELGRKAPDEFRKAPKRPVIVVLDNVRSLNNVGSVFRSADRGCPMLAAGPAERSSAGLGRPMDGVDYGTYHYIVFEPTQVKSVENRGTV